MQAWGQLVCAGLRQSGRQLHQSPGVLGEGWGVLEGAPVLQQVFRHSRSKQCLKYYRV